MNPTRWNEWIRRQLQTGPLEPASEEFYEGVWQRIRKQASSLPMHGRRTFPEALRTACWQTAPLLAASLLGILLYAWYAPPEMNGPRASAMDSYVWDAALPPSDAALIYQILNVEPGAGTEAQP